MKNAPATEGENVPQSTATRRRSASPGTRRTAGAAAMRTAARKQDEQDGRTLLKELVAHLRKRKAGTVRQHPDGNYARVSVDGKTVGYLVPRRRAVALYANALSASMPAGVSHTKVKLGSHHFGRGEVLLEVAERGDFGDAARALAAAAKHPIPRKARA